MFLWWPSFKSVQRFKFHWELLVVAAAERGQNVQTLKIFSSESACQIPILFIRNVSWVTIYKNCSIHTDWLKNMVSGGIRKGANWQNLKIPFFASVSLILRNFNTNLTLVIRSLICSISIDWLQNHSNQASSQKG